MKFQNTEFRISVAHIKDLPENERLPEIAVLGRSNVGKSSLLNNLFGAKNLVKTSSTPGKTRDLNFFLTDDRLFFVDMPGYGYASANFQEKKRWAALIESYLNQRQALKALLFLFDIRRTPTDEDLQMLKWIHHRRLPTLLILTKVDKVGQSERILQTRRIKEKLQISSNHPLKNNAPCCVDISRIEEIPSIYYSVLKNEGRKELIAKINGYIHGPY